MTANDLNVKIEQRSITIKYPISTMSNISNNRYGTDVSYIPSWLVLTLAAVSCRCEILQDSSILQDMVWALLSGVYNMNQLCKGSL